MSKARTRFEVSAGIAGILLLAGIAYWPGLSGSFLFDDYSNLSLLGRYGTVNNPDSLWLYILSGFSGPTGRPLSYLSFLIDANHWPADPWPFKRTNILIHLINGVLLFGLTRDVLRSLGHRISVAGYTGLLAMALWLLHPLWVSTTLYAVQRMTELSTLFTLAGLWLWVHVRVTRPAAVTPAMVVAGFVGLWGCGLLAILSKENGALLPACALVLESTVLAVHQRKSGEHTTSGFQALRAIAIGLPLLMLVGYMSTLVPTLLAGDAGNRAFTPLQRLMTEGRILWDYVAQIILPRPYPGGLFNDNITISTGLLTPWTTLGAWTAWIVIGVWAWRKRLQYPATSLAILFFLVGHTLESSFIPLELYFEHRNYLPAVMIPVPIALALTSTTRLTRRSRMLIAISFVGALTALTLVRADLWGTPFLQALKWAHVNPDSPRAQHYLAGFWSETGHIREASRLNQKAIELDPNGLPWRMSAITYACARGDSPMPAVDRLVTAFRDNPRGSGAVSTFQLSRLLDSLDRGACADYRSAGARLGLVSRLERATPDTAFTPLRRSLLQRRARLLLELNHPEAALDSFAELVRRTHDPGVLLRSAAILASHDQRPLALRLLDRPLPQRGPHPLLSLDTLRDWYLERTGYYIHERDNLQRAIRKDMTEMSHKAPTQKQTNGNHP